MFFRVNFTLNLSNISSEEECKLKEKKKKERKGKDQNKVDMARARTLNLLTREEEVY